MKKYIFLIILIIISIILGVTLEMLNNNFKPKEKEVSSNNHDLNIELSGDVNILNSGDINQIVSNENNNEVSHITPLYYASRLHPFRTRNTWGAFWFQGTSLRDTYPIYPCKTIEFRLQTKLRTQATANRQRKRRPRTVAQ